LGHARGNCLLTDFGIAKWDVGFLLRRTGSDTALRLIFTANFFTGNSTVGEVTAYPGFAVLPIP
jgi:hypothetical protein